MEKRLLVFGLLFNVFLQSLSITRDPLVTDLVYLDIDIAGKEVGRIIVGLFGGTTPKTVQNFISLANHEKGYGYRGSIFHRLIPGFMMQGGDFTKSDGTGGYSIYGHSFLDENFIHLHYGAGWVCMANAGPDSNGSQFYITYVITPWIDGTHTCFGKVVFGMNTVRKCEKVQTGKDDRPLDRVEIYDSGTLPLRKPYLVAMADAVEDELENNIGDIADEIDEDYEDGEEQYEDNADNKEEL